VKGENILSCLRPLRNELLPDYPILSPLTLFRARYPRNDLFLLGTLRRFNGIAETKKAVAMIEQSERAILIRLFLHEILSIYRRRISDVHPGAVREMDSAGILKIRKSGPASTGNTRRYDNSRQTAFRPPLNLSISNPGAVNRPPLSSPGTRERSANRNFKLAVGVISFSGSIERERERERERGVVSVSIRF